MRKKLPQYRWNHELSAMQVCQTVLEEEIEMNEEGRRQHELCIHLLENTHYTVKSTGKTVWKITPNPGLFNRAKTYICRRHFVFGHRDSRIISARWTR